MHVDRPFSPLLRLAGVLLLLALLPAPVAGQREPARVVLAGTVVDERSGAPLPGTLVELRGRNRSVVTDRSGRFALPELAPGGYELRVMQLGYDTLTTRVEAREGAVARIALRPDPVVLQGIRVVTDRFRARRNAVATSVRAFDRRELLSSASFDALDFVRTRSGVFPAICPFEAAVATCAWVRGRAQPVSVYIDDAPTIGGLDHLELYRTQDLYLVEVFGGGRQIRAYTNWYVERAGRGKVRPVPVIY